MKIILFLGAPFEHYQGGTEYQYKVLEDVLSKKYQIFYLFRNPTRLEDNNFITYNYKIRKNYNRYAYTDILQIYKLIKDIGPDVIYKRGLNYITSVGVYYAKRNNCDMIFHIASQKDVEVFKWRLKKDIASEYFDKQLMKYTIKRVAKIIGQAEYQNILLQNNFDRKCDLIIPNFHEVPNDNIEKKPPIKILWVANFKPWKQPEIFIKLAKYFKNQKNIIFIMIGRPSDNTYQTKLNIDISRSNNLEYKGELGIKDVNQIFSHSHIFVNTSINYEGFPNTFIQAWMRKVSVVSLNVDPDDILKNEGIGFHSGSFEQLIKDTKRLIEDEKFREIMGERAQRYAIRNHSLANIERIIDLIVK